jgi:hypothetical protein
MERMECHQANTPDRAKNAGEQGLSRLPEAGEGQVVVLKRAGIKKPLPGCKGSS